MHKEPRGERRPADVICAAVKVNADCDRRDRGPRRTGMAPIYLQAVDDAFGIDIDYA